MNEESLFHEALAKAPGERSAFLDQVCAGKPELRSAVEALLAAHEGSGMLDRSFVGVDATVESNPGDSSSAATGEFTPTPEEAPSVRVAPTADYQAKLGEGTVIAGRYTLEQKLGEGGMGEVWVAKQTEPVKRRVALKLIKPGMDSRAVLQRFEQERQALAMMDHPNIAKVLDAGLTPAGQPFFVMELVNGLPLTKYCDEMKLTPKERLELFVPICQAVQHAHHKGIVHRDLKPANILVTIIDAKPAPKVIDFGVAKATAGKLTDESLSTQFGAVVGTLEYMSPEQAGFSGEDIDTRADIYSLGVILYELLTGLRPIDAKRLKRAALTEMIRIIREEEPSKPSTRLSTDESLPSLAALRQTEPRRLMTILRGELDWVVMKCLEKPRDRRYETANALARDIQRYLADEPVEARPPSTGYRLKKFVSRNKGQVIAAGLVFLALVAGIIGTSLGLFRANEARKAEVKQRKIAEVEKQNALNSEKFAQQQKSRAEAREQQAIDAVKRFRDVVVEEPTLKNNPALEHLRKKLLKEPLEFFKSLREQLQADNDTRPNVLASIARAAHDHAHLSEEIGDIEDSLRVHVESLAIWESLARAHPTEPDSWMGLATIANCRGIMLSKTGHPGQALESYSKALAIRERLARENPSVAAYKSALAYSHHNIGLLQKNTGHLDNALESNGKALAIRERLARENPSVTEFRVELAASYLNVGNLQSETGHPRQALESYGKALAIAERLARENPRGTEFQTHLSVNYNSIGGLQSDTGHPDQALESYGHALAILEKLARENPSVTEYQRNLTVIHNNIGVIQYETGHSDQALESYGKGLAICERLARDHPSVTAFQSGLALSYNNIGLLQSTTGHPDQALVSYAKGLAIREQLARENPSVTELQRDSASSHHTIGTLHSETGHPDQAIESLGKALAIRERLAKDHPESSDYACDVGGTLNNLAVLDRDAHRWVAARSKAKQAIKWQKQALAAKPNHPTYRHFLKNHLTVLITSTRALGNDDEADAAQRELNALNASDPKFAALNSRLTAISQGEKPKDNAERLAFAQLAYDTKRYALAARLWGEALENEPKLGEDRQVQHRYNAACVAALAAAGQGQNEPPLDDDAKAKLRSRARLWLKAELVEWSTRVDSAQTQAKATISQTLAHWKQDSDLAGIRDEKELAKLPEAERKEWQSLWAEVQALLDRAAAAKSTDAKRASE
jgi:serine/threonine protein kinase